MLHPLGPVVDLAVAIVVDAVVTRGQVAQVLVNSPGRGVGGAVDARRRGVAKLPGSAVDCRIDRHRLPMGSMYCRPQGVECASAWIGVRREVQGIGADCLGCRFCTKKTSGSSLLMKSYQAKTWARVGCCRTTALARRGIGGVDHGQVAAWRRVRVGPGSAESASSRSLIAPSSLTISDWVLASWARRWASCGRDEDQRDDDADDHDDHQQLGQGEPPAPGEQGRSRPRPFLVVRVRF